VLVSTLVVVTRVFVRSHRRQIRNVVVVGVLIQMGDNHSIFDGSVLVLPDHSMSPLMDCFIQLGIPSMYALVSTAITRRGESPNRLPDPQLLGLNLVTSEREELVIWYASNHEAGVECDL